MFPYFGKQKNNHEKEIIARRKTSKNDLTKLHKQNFYYVALLSLYLSTSAMLSDKYY